MTVCVYYFQPYITADTIRRELPPEQAEYCLQKMKVFNVEDANELDYTKFSNNIFGESDL